MGFQKLKPKIIAYCDYKNFDNAEFRSHRHRKKSCKKFSKNTQKPYFESLDTKKLLITEVSGGLSNHHLPKIHQKVKKLISLMMVKPHPVTRSSVRRLSVFL